MNIVGPKFWQDKTTEISDRCICLTEQDLDCQAAFVGQCPVAEAPSVIFFRKQLSTSSKQIRQHKRWVFVRRVRQRSSNCGPSTGAKILYDESPPPCQDIVNRQCLNAGSASNFRNGCRPMTPVRLQIGAFKNCKQNILNFFTL